MTTQLTHEVQTYRQTDHAAVDAVFLNRWSPRSFLEKEVPDDILMSLFEAARWAPSGGNQQPWRFIVARTRAERDAFAPFINPGNTEWCMKAPVLTLLISKTTNAKGNPHGSHAFDAGAAWGYLALQAHMHGLFAHAMGGFDKQKARETLHIPDEYAPHVVIAIGYRGPVEALSAANQERERPSGRKSLSEIMMEGSFRPE